MVCVTSSSLQTTLPSGHVPLRYPTPKLPHACASCMMGSSPSLDCPISSIQIKAGISSPSCSTRCASWQEYHAIPSTVRQTDRAWTGRYCRCCDVRQMRIRKAGPIDSPQSWLHIVWQCTTSLELLQIWPCWDGKSCQHHSSPDHQ